MFTNLQGSPFPTVSLSFTVMRFVLLESSFSLQNETLLWLPVALTTTVPIATVDKHCSFLGPIGQIRLSENVFLVNPVPFPLAHRIFRIVVLGFVFLDLMINITLLLFSGFTCLTHAIR
jgi:hypothetical protein